jgi:hypothetical protein
MTGRPANSRPATPLAAAVNPRRRKIAMNTVAVKAVFMMEQFFMRVD